MKNTIILFIFFVAQLKAQDTLRFRNGEVQAVKVVEIGVNEIKYNRFDNQSGPTYIVNKSEVSSIKYRNGQEDKFNNVITYNSVIPQNNLQGTSSIDDKMFIQRGKIIFHSKSLSENRLRKLIYACNDLDKQAKLNSTFNEMIKYKHKQHTAFALGLGLGLGAPFIGIIAAAATYDVAPFIGGVLVGTAVGVSGGVFSGINKKKRLAKMKEITRIYNGEQ